MSLIAAAVLAAGPWLVRPEAGTDVPLQVGVGVLAEGPYRLRARTAVGFLPEPYVDLINEAAQSFDETYTDANATLVANTLQDSLVWRTHLGWRPFEAHGFYFHAGYTLVTLGGGSTAEELIEGLTGQELPDDQNASDRTFTAGSTLHLLDVELGWEWVLWRELTLRAGLGWSTSVSSSATIEADFTLRGPGEAAVSALEQYTEDYLVDIYDTYVHPPSIAIQLGWQFDVGADAPPATQPAAD